LHDSLLRDSRQENKTLVGTPLVRRQTNEELYEAMKTSGTVYTE